MKTETKFKKGQSGNPAGRPKGKPNKTTTEIREKFQELIEGKLEQLEVDLASLEPMERIKAVIELSKFVIPTLKATELSSNDPDKNKIVVTLKR